MNIIYYCILSLLKFPHKLPESNWFKSSPREHEASLWIENLFTASMWQQSTVSLKRRRAAPYIIYSINFFLQQCSVATAAVYSLLLQFCFDQIYFNSLLLEEQHTFVIHFFLRRTYIIQQLFTVYLTCQIIVISMCLHNPTFVYSLLLLVFHSFVV